MDAGLLRQRLPDLGEGSPASPRLVVDLWLAVPGPAGWRVLLLRRTPERDAFWQGVSGRVEPGDAHLEAAARREIAEETGFSDEVRILDLGRWIDFVGPRSGLSFRKRSLGAVLPPGADPATTRLSHEHDEVRLVTFDEARAMVRFPVNVEELDRLEAAVRDLPPPAPREPAPLAVKRLAARTRRAVALGLLLPFVLPVALAYGVLYLAARDRDGPSLRDGLTLGAAGAALLLTLGWVAFAVLLVVR
jgi:8-oxo-dGTP pyrophosphatase MutT (NUDIX family)